MDRASVSNSVIILGFMKYAYEGLNDTSRLMAQTFAGMGFDIVYVDPVSMCDLFRFKLLPSMRRVSNALVIYPGILRLPLRATTHFSRLVSRILGARFKKTVFRVIKNCAFVYAASLSSWRDHEFINAIKEETRDIKIIFECHENLRKDVNHPLTKKIIDRSDLIVTGTDEITSLVRKAYPTAEVVQLGQGVNYALWQSVELFNSRKKYAFGFTGHLSSWIDYDLLELLAKQLPRDEILLVGPVAPDSKKRLSSILRANANIVWIGARSYRELPEIVSQVEVLILPRIVDENSAACDPVKLYEALAAGIPIVTTALPAAKKLSNALYYSANSDQFVVNAAQALADVRTGLFQRSKKMAGKEIAMGRNFTSRAMAILTKIEFHVYR